jgi:hypothetical protein
MRSRLRAAAWLSISCALFYGCAAKDPKAQQGPDLIISVTDDGKLCSIHGRDVECSEVRAVAVDELKLPSDTYIRVDVVGRGSEALSRGLNLQAELMAAGFGMTILGLNGTEASGQ